MLLQQLTEEQRTVVGKIVVSIENDRQEAFFIEGRGGSGKTFVYETLYHILHGKGYKVRKP